MLFPNMVMISILSAKQRGSQAFYSRGLLLLRNIIRGPFLEVRRTSVFLFSILIKGEDFFCRSIFFVSVFFIFNERIFLL